jgi:hypothetical protein
LRVSVEVTNRGAGHAVPTGLPERRIVVRAITRAAAGTPHAAAEHAFGRWLVDGEGEPAPFYEAVRVARDDRIPARGSRTARLALVAPRIGQLELEVVWLRFDAGIARRLEIDEVEEVPLLRATVILRPHRTALPRTIELQR